MWNYSPKLIILVRAGENTSYKPKLQRSSQNAWPILFKAVKVMKDKKKKKSVTGWRRLRRIITKCNVVPRLDPGTAKNIIA